MSLTFQALKKITVAIILISGIVVIITIFWRQEIKYAIPTAIPHDYISVLPGQTINLPEPLEQGAAYFIHFYNPDCPCSRFNSKHIQSLINDHSDSIKFVIVIPDAAALMRAKSELGNDLVFVEDVGHDIAKACGVYSTPQAVIVASDGKLFYRGNYNRARYCTTRASNFAEFSLIAFINNQPPQLFGLEATQSYGCALDAAQTEFEFF